MDVTSRVLGSASENSEKLGASIVHVLHDATEESQIQPSFYILCACAQLKRALAATSHQTARVDRRLLVSYSELGSAHKL